jgi:hypothetical protein
MKQFRMNSGPNEQARKQPSWVANKTACPQPTRVVPRQRVLTGPPDLPRGPFRTALLWADGMDHHLRSSRVASPLRGGWCVGGVDRSLRRQPRAGKPPGCGVDVETAFALERTNEHNVPCATGPHGYGRVYLIAWRIV